MNLECRVLLHGLHADQQGERQQLQSCHRHGLKTVLAQTADITKCHVILVVFFKF